MSIEIPCEQYVTPSRDLLVAIANEIDGLLAAGGAEVLNRFREQIERCKQMVFAYEAAKNKAEWEAYGAAIKKSLADPELAKNEATKYAVLEALN